MSDATRTERRLLDSIRKAKSATQPERTSAGAETPPPPAAEPPQPPPAPQLSPPGRPRNAAATPTPERDDGPRRDARAADGYQLSRRIWPD
jgi:hypothetical protein